MKKLLIIALFFAAAFSTLWSKEVKLLTIGNSFADSAFKYLPQVAASVPDCDLVMERANHGGCELDRHWSYILREESSPDVKLYRKATASLKEILKSKKWDFITIQQASHKSWRPETYQPFAKNIKEYVNKNAPSAEVVLQQTWSYRSDDPRIRKGGEWNIDQTEMFKRLEQAYAECAKELDLRIIPMGLAVQNARNGQKVKFKDYGADALKKMKYPDLPDQSGSIVGKLRWAKGKDGKMRINRDSIHLNERGEYLQACVWFAFFFGKNAEEITFVPDGINPEDAKFLRSVAQKTVSTFKQPNAQQ